MYDALIVMSNFLNPDGSLSEDCRIRTEKGIEDYFNNESPILLMSGLHWVGGQYDDTLIPFSQAEAMTSYAAKRGVPLEVLSKEEYSLDTVGQVCFCKWIFALPRNWKQIKKITSDFHAYRVEKISEFIYGPTFKIDIERINTKKELVSDLKEKEDEKLKPFRDTFEGISPGDDISLFHRLFKVHKRYNDGSDKNKEVYQKVLSLHPDWRK